MSNTKTVKNQIESFGKNQIESFGLAHVRLVGVDSGWACFPGYFRVGWVVGWGFLLFSLALTVGQGFSLPAERVSFSSPRAV